jgi:hypothetical protein
MLVLFDQGTLAPLRHLLQGHAVSTAYELGWSALKNGELLQLAEDNGFEILVTTDTNLKYQQNLSSRKIAIVVLSTTSWPRIKRASDKISAALSLSTAGSYREVAIP